jgi:dATP pyrophosphohydrolase
MARGMPRQPINILVLPFRPSAQGGLEYAVFRRADMGDVWQAVAGGVESGESPQAAALRELAEETGLTDAALVVLDAHATVPASFFRAYRTEWGPEVYVVRELAFGARVDASQEIVLSDEHAEVCWMVYEAAAARLAFDSNRTALWELNARLTAA